MKTARWWGVLVCLALWPAAAAAGGWYLLTPPQVKEDGVWRPWTGAPLPKWDQASAYGSPAECEIARASWFDQAIAAEMMARRAFKDAGIDGGDQALRPFSALTDTARGSRCVASDDPRLR